MPCNVSIVRCGVFNKSFKLKKKTKKKRATLRVCDCNIAPSLFRS